MNTIRDVFYSLLYLVVNCSILFVPEEYLVGFFLEISSGIVSVLHSLARQWIHVMRQLMRLLGRISRSSCWCVGDDFRLVSVFCVALGSTVDTCGASVYKAFWKNFSQFLPDTVDSDLEVVSRLSELLVFSAMLGSTVVVKVFLLMMLMFLHGTVFKLMKGKYTINYFQYQDLVECVCMLEVGFAALTIFAPTTTTTSSSS